MSTPELNFATPTELISALPHLLGFIPTNDIIALMLGPSSTDPAESPLRAAIRCPVTIDPDHAQRFPTLCHLIADQFPAALLIAVCNPRHDTEALAALQMIRTALHDSGITVRRILSTHTVTEPDTWIDPDTGATGPTKAYTDSPATALGVVEGRIIAPSRDDMQNEFATTDVAPHIDLEAQDLAALIGTTATDLHRTIVENTTPTTELAARAAAVVTAHTALRNAYLRLAAGHELAAARTWTHIAAAHRGRTRTELLTMAAVAYYCADDTVRAGLAITHAAAATQTDNTVLPRLTTTLYAALEAGMPPSKIRSLIPSRNATPIPGTAL
jgi:hypothetical protein